MDSTQYLIFENAIKQMLYSNSLGKSSLWLMGNICLILLFAALVLFFVILNYKERKLAGIEEQRLIKIFSDLPKRLLRYKIFDSGIFYIKKFSFYVEFGLCALVFAVLTHISVFTALVLTVLYIIFRTFLFKRMQKLFKRADGVVVPTGVYLLFFLYFSILIFLFNVLPALVEVSAENQMVERAQKEGWLQ